MAALPLIQGRIVFPRTPIPDPQGRNPKPGRPFVVVTSTQDIPSADVIQIVGITDELTESPSEHYVPLQWGPHAKTRLRSRSAALCTWLVSVNKLDVDIGAGYVVPSDILQIVNKVIAMNADRP